MDGKLPEFDPPRDGAVTVVGPSAGAIADRIQASGRSQSRDRIQESRDARTNEVEQFQGFTLKQYKRKRRATERQRPFVRFVSQVLLFRIHSRGSSKKM